MSAVAKKKISRESAAPVRRHAKATGVSAVTPAPMTAQELSEKVNELTALNRVHKRKIFDLYTIFEISRNFSSVLNYYMLLDTFLLTSLAQVGASRAAVLHRGSTQSNKMYIVRKRGSGKFPSESLGFSDDSPLAGFLARLNRPITVAEAFTNHPSADEKKILGLFKDGLVVPLIYQSRLSGVLLVADKISNRDYSMDDIEFMSILASQISVAIENARLYESEKSIAQQLRSAQQQLVNSERLAALGEMSAKVAHEINNPLGIIKNYILLLKRTLDQNVQANNYADIVGQEIDRIARIVRELLDFHRPGGLVFEKVQVADVINNVLELMERQLEKCGIHVKRDFDKSIPAIDGAAENLKQVFLNILINACDAMSSGGTLQVNLRREKDQVIATFIDSGPGIRPEVVPHIFEPFYTTKEHGKGTGLGLSVCWGIIRKHNGTITFSNMHPGSSFEIRIPIEQKATKQ
jgi:signal transduction histidine kinase